jgi:hypothetical protein
MANDSKVDDKSSSDASPTSLAGDAAHSHVKTDDATIAAASDAKAMELSSENEKVNGQSPIDTRGRFVTGLPDFS